MTACAAVGFVPTLGQSAPHFVTAVMLVAARFGIAIVPASLRRLAIEGVAYLELDTPAPEVNLVLVHAANEHAAITRNFINIAGRQAAH